MHVMEIEQSFQTGCSISCVIHKYHLIRGRRAEIEQSILEAGRSPSAN